MSNLFSSINIKGFEIRNRIVMPPMVCFGWSDNDGFVTEEHVEHYDRRSKGGTGLVIVEATCIKKDGRLASTQLGIWSDEHIEGLKRITEVCHKNGAVILIQIHHAGFKTPQDVLAPALAPSDMEKDGQKIARALTIDEIHSIQEDFLAAAKRAKAAGFDGIELHGAHGYLINQFVSPFANRRDDEYGGSFDNRMRFGLEIIKKIKTELGENFIIDIRMGANEPDAEAGVQIARAYEEAGVDLLHVSAGIGSGQYPAVPEGFEYNWIVYCGTEVKKNVTIPVIVVNDIRTPERAAYLVENNLADFTAIGKGLLVDSSWAKKAVNKEEIVSCLKCLKCAWYRNGKLCPRNR